MTENQQIVGSQKSRVITTIEHCGKIVEHIACSSSEALTAHLLKSNREGRRNFPGRPVRLPKSPAHPLDYFLTLQGAEAVIEHSLPDQVISIQAGVSIASLQEMLAKNNQWFPICLPDDDTSLMEYINQGSSGPLEHGFGEARDLVLGMQVVLGSGELINCGGKVVKNVTGYDLPKLFAGAHGTLCVPFSAHLRLYALPETASTTIFYFKDANEAFRTASLLRRSGLPLSCLEIADGDLFEMIGDKDLSPYSSFSAEEVYLCVQIHGKSSVVEELEKELAKVVADGVSTQQKLGGEAEKRFWKFMARPVSCMQADWLEIAGPTAVIEKLLTEIKAMQKSGSLPGIGRLSWAARPGRNKALLVFQEEQIPQKGTDASKGSSLSGKVMGILSRAAAGLSSRIAIAGADDGYLWKVRHCPEEDPVLNELKHRLKHEFDPQGVLNPLVVL